MKNLYIDLHSVFDVRAGCVRILNSETYDQLLEKNYHQRKSDFFDGIDRETYLKLYRSYDTNTLVQSTVTNIFHFIYRQLTEMIQETFVSQVDNQERPKLHVNIFPYALSSEEQHELRMVIHAMLRGIVGVDIINEDIQTLNPQLCYKQYLMMIMYDYDQYINTHSDALIKESVPELIIVAPMVYFNTNPDTDEETIEYLAHGINSLALLEAGIASRIGLKFINVDYFSIIYPDDRALNVPKGHDIEPMDLDQYQDKRQSVVTSPSSV